MPSTTTFEIAELLKSVANSELDAFRRLYDHYLQKVYAYSYFLTRSSEQAEDLTQELFAKIWIKRAELRTIENFDAWLTTLVRNSAYNFLKRHAVEQKALRRIQVSQQLESLSVEDSLINKEYSKIFQEAINQLPPQQKKVFLLSRNEGLKQEEIASNLGISLNTVKNHMKAALFSIRTYMKSYVSILVFWLLLKFLS
jgi:RNA polymerase sigma-70 factor (ECF subfamily)